LQKIKQENYEIHTGKPYRDDGTTITDFKSKEGQKQYARRYPLLSANY
jgi:hypothetical protein